MAKKDKITVDLQRLINSQNFENEQELKAFMDSLIGKPIPELAPEDLTNEELAEELVFKAMDIEDTIDGLPLVLEALLLDEKCLRAYEFIASMQPHPLLRIPYYTHAIGIGRKIFDKAFIRKNKGDFWHMVETRPFMRLLCNYAIDLMELGKYNQANVLLQELIDLNPDDNMGARYYYWISLIGEGKMETFEVLEKKYEGDPTALFIFSKALYEFISSPDSSLAQQTLQKGINLNKFIPARLTAKNPPELVPDAYRPGSMGEAQLYASFAWFVWQKYPKAIEWLKTIKSKK